MRMEGGLFRSDPDTGHNPIMAPGGVQPFHPLARMALYYFPYYRTQDAGPLLPGMSANLHGLSRAKVVRG